MVITVFTDDSPPVPLPYINTNHELVQNTVDLYLGKIAHIYTACALCSNILHFVMYFSLK